MTSEYRLTQGPSRELLFDCMRLGPMVPELRVVEFWGEYTTAERAKVGSSLPVKIEGVHEGGNEGRAFFFWGREKKMVSGEKWVPAWDAPDGNFVFGKWDTHTRSGYLQRRETSFFERPPTQADIETDFINACQQMCEESQGVRVTFGSSFDVKAAQRLYDSYGIAFNFSSNARYALSQVITKKSAPPALTITLEYRGRIQGLRQIARVIGPHLIRVEPVTAE